MNGNVTRANLQQVLVNEFSEIGNLLGLHKIDIHSDNYITSIYLIGTNALELEIDWHENVLFVYIVHLIDDHLPNEDIIYRYHDGPVCRTYIDEVYQKKNPLYCSNNRTKPEFLLDLFGYYKKLIQSDPAILQPYFLKGDS